MDHHLNPIVSITNPQKLSGMPTPGAVGRAPGTPGAPTGVTGVGL